MNSINPSSNFDTSTVNSTHIKVSNKNIHHFIGYFSSIFTPESRFKDYQIIHNLFFSHECNPLPHEIISHNFKPILGLVKMPDHSKEDQIKNYHILD